MTTKSVHLSLASTNTNICRVTVIDDSGLNIRVNGNARCLPSFSWSDVATMLFTSGLTGQQTLSPLYTHHTDNQNNMTI